MTREVQERPCDLNLFTWRKQRFFLPANFWSQNVGGSQMFLIPQIVND